MRELYILNNHALGILDKDNYVVYDKTKPTKKVNKKTNEEVIGYSYSYYTSMEQAIRELCRLNANEACSDLSTWVESLQRGYAEVVAAVTAGA